MISAIVPRFHTAQYRPAESERDEAEEGERGGDHGGRPDSFPSERVMARNESGNGFVWRPR